MLTFFLFKLKKQINDRFLIRFKKIYYKSFLIFSKSSLDFMFNSSAIFPPEEKERKYYMRYKK